MALTRLSHSLNLHSSSWVNQSPCLLPNSASYSILISWNLGVDEDDLCWAPWVERCLNPRMKTTTKICWMQEMSSFQPSLDLKCSRNLENNWRRFKQCPIPHWLVLGASRKEDSQKINDSLFWSTWCFKWFSVKIGGGGKLWNCIMKSRSIVLHVNMAPLDVFKSMV